MEQPVGLKLNMELLQHAARSLGFNVLTNIEDTNLIWVVNGGDGHTILFHGTVPSTLSVVAQRCANDKFYTKSVLARYGLPIAASGRYVLGTGATAEDFIRETIGKLPTSVKNVVVKPTHGARGHGVFMDLPVEDFAVIDNAIKNCFDLGYRDIMLEEQIEKPRDFRFFVVGTNTFNAEVVAVLHRQPANVVGDGVSSIEVLIENKNRIRSRNPYTSDKLISNTQHRSKRIPEAGEEVFFTSTANMSTGGDGIDYTGHIGLPNDAAIRAHLSTGLLYSGVDVLVKGNTNEFVISEINAVPDFAMHHYPTHGAGIDVAKEIILTVFNARNLGK